jgi:serine/threonine protein kinase
MSDSIFLSLQQGIQARSGIWYNNMQTLGTGGNAVTFLVLASSGPHRGIPFALKIFRKLSMPERRDRFLEEVEFLRTCEHPAIMRIYDDGVFSVVIDDQTYQYPFVVAEYLPSTLHDAMRGNFSLVQKVSYALQLLSALQFLNCLTPKVVHRDIKPKNIFIKGNSCVLGDFGLMKRLDGHEEVDRDVFKESIGPGMPFFYRTPDLVAYANNESDLTTKSDVFQLGLVVAEMFTGWNPARKPPDNNMYAPVELAPLGHIGGAQAPGIRHLIESMLNFNCQTRPDAAAIIDPWRGVLFEAVERSHELDGHAF